MRTVNKKSFALSPDAYTAPEAFGAIDGRLSLHSILNMPGALLRRAQRVCAAIFAEEVGEAELTSVQYAALVAIRDYPGIDATTLSGLIFLDRATIGGVLERLVAKGLAGRRESLVDRRVKEMNITPAGRALLTEIEAAVQRVQERLLEPLTASEKKLFLSLLRKLIARESAPALVQHEMPAEAAVFKRTSA